MSKYTVPVKSKFGDDNALYVPEYPTLKSLGAKQEDFLITLTKTDESYISDKSIDEIEEAYNSGRDLYVYEKNMDVKIKLSYWYDKNEFEFHNFSLLTEKGFSCSYGNWLLYNQERIASQYLLGGISALNTDGTYQGVPIEVNQDTGFAYAALNIADKTEEDTEYTEEVKKDPTTKKLYVKPSAQGGGSSEKEWKLIKTINISESITQILVDQDDEKNPFSLDEIFICGKNVSCSDNTQLLIKINNATEYIATTNSFFGTTNKTFFVKYENNGIGFCMSKSSTYNLFIAAEQNPGLRLLEFNEKITSILMYLQYSNTFDSGEIKIYGR